MIIDFEQVLIPQLLMSRVNRTSIQALKVNLSPVFHICVVERTLLWTFS